MLKSASRRVLVFALLLAPCIAFHPLSALAQSDSKPSDDSTKIKRGRKYTPPPETCRISVTVVKDANSKPVESAAVIFHPMEGERDKGVMELKTNQDGQAVIDVIPIGDTVRLQVIANGFQTYGEDYKIDAATKEITVRLKRPVRQYSTYEHANQTPAAKPADTAPAADDSKAAPPADKPADKK